MSQVDRKRAIKPPALKDLETMPVSKRMKKAAPSPHASGVTPKARSDAKARPSVPSTPRGKHGGSELAVKVEEEIEMETTATNANHNKYCHFCQHVKVRASSMLACENKECCRRFCEHCLLTHLGETVEPMSSDAWNMVGGKAVWNCPICRSKCCCSVADCGADHRHCKAYRYRRRRAEQASKRMAAVADKRGVKKPPTTTPAPPTKKAAPPAPRLTVVLPATGAPGPAAFQSVAAMNRRAADMIETPPPSFSFLLPKAAWGSEPAHPRLASSARELATARDPSPVDSIVSAAADEDSAARPASAFMGEGEADAAGLWACAEVGEYPRGEGSISIEDEALGGMYGHMCEHVFPPESEESGDDVLPEALLSAGGWAVHEEARRHPDAAAPLDLDLELDEALWLRKTYETVYNPAARQRALQALVSGSGCPPGKRAEAGASPGFSGFGLEPLPVARKCTVVYD
ncbi:hypothetical protein T484DRAFT_1886376 [Baffinella frigidus]|nr:hypothetical protein T484DRAFT_1886376 [Cryptophyta sp. CCMP2293]